MYLSVPQHRAFHAGERSGLWRDAGTSVTRKGWPALWDCSYPVRCATWHWIYLQMEEAEHAIWCQWLKAFSLHLQGLLSHSMCQWDIEWSLPWNWELQQHWGLKKGITLQKNHLIVAPAVGICLYTVILAGFNWEGHHAPLEWTRQKGAEACLGQQEI